MKVIKGILITALLLFTASLHAQPPGWEVDPADFEYSATFTWQFDFASVNEMADGDSLAAFVGDELRGSVQALLHPGFQEYYFPILVYSNTISGEEVTFRYYDASADRVIEIILETDQTQIFELDQALGSFSDPLTAIIDDLIPQEIIFEVLEDKTFGEDAFELMATGGTSGNAITFVSSDPEVLTIDGATVTIIGAGAATITASQLGNDYYAEALPVDQELTVLKAAQVIDFQAPVEKTFGDAPFDMDIIGGGSDNAIELISSDESIATIDGLTVTIVGVGTITITANQAGNDDYLDAVLVEQNLTINKAEQTITFDALADKTFGDAPFVLNFSGGNSGNEIALDSSDESVATINGTTVTITGAGSTSIIATQAGSANYLVADLVEQQLTVKKATQVITFNPLSEKTFGDASFDLEVTGGASGNEVTFTSSDETIATIAGVTVTILGVGDISIIASQAGNDNYEDAVSVEQNLTVSKAGQTISFEPLPEKTFGDVPFELIATGGESGLPITFRSADESVATVSGSTITIVGAGITEITASQLGDDNYDPAADVIQTLIVNKASQIITLDPIGSKLITDPSIEVVATVNTGLELTYELTGPATIDGFVITLTGASGIVAVTVSQVGNDNYEAVSATETFEVMDPTKDEQSITFSAISDKTYGDASFSINASASSDLEVDYRVVSGPATLDDDELTITGAGEVTIEATQAGDDDYNPALSVEKTFVVAKAILMVTANDQIRLYGADNPALTLSYEGFAYEDEAGYLQTLPTVATSADHSSNVDAYIISVEGAADDNYTFEYTAGTLTIEKAPLVITAEEQTMIYGDSLPELTLSYSGFLNDEIDTVLNVQPTASTSATITSDVGTYDILLDGGEDNNYALELITGILDIRPAALVASADSIEAVYGGEIPVLTISYTGFKIEDSEADINAPSATTSAAQGSFPGTYPIVLAGGEAMNYELRLEGSVLEIDKALLTVLVVNDTITYGDEIPEPQITYSGFVNDDTVGVLDSQPLTTMIADAMRDAGEYTIAVGEGSSDLYSFEYLNGTLLIQKAQATIAVADLEQVADGEPKLPTITTEPEGLSYEITYNGEVEPPSLPGEYTIDISITDPNYEGTTSLSLLIEGSVTAVEDESFEVLVYPNPASDWVRLENLQASSHVNVLTMEGKLLIGRRTNDTNLTLPLVGLKPGMYLISVINTSGIRDVKRLLIK